MPRRCAPTGHPLLPPVGTASAGAPPVSVVRARAEDGIRRCARARNDCALRPHTAEPWLRLTRSGPPKAVRGSLVGVGSGWPFAASAPDRTGSAPAGSTKASSGAGVSTCTVCWPMAIVTSSNRTAGSFQCSCGLGTVKYCILRDEALTSMRRKPCRSALYWSSVSPGESGMTIPGCTPVCISWRCR